eukprot:GEMP01067025.1.p1 GENE.GEMP01067025.1~~GEMP01067025.1.p1  ORF type:complete len:198 (+),score=48.93 GEMP01067025.1:63-656(+)
MPRYRNQMMMDNENNMVDGTSTGSAGNEPDITKLLQEAAKLKTCQLDEKQRVFKGAPEFFQLTMRHDDTVQDARTLARDAKLKKSNEWKLNGNVLLAKEDYDNARDEYARALSVYMHFERDEDYLPLRDDSAEQPVHVALLFNNLCLLMLKQERYKDAGYAVEECLKRLPEAHTRKRFFVVHSWPSKSRTMNRLSKI